MMEELKDNELSTGILLGEKPASEDLKAAATPSITVTDLSKWHGFDITRKGGKMKKKRYIFALPMMLTNNAGGTLGTVTKMDTPTPVLYLEFPEGRFKCLGRISKTGSRFMPLELTKKSVECKDIIEIMVIFSTVYWVGRAEDNPDEEPLPVPPGLLQAGPAETTLGDVFKEGVSKNIKGPQRRSGPRVSKGKAKYEDEDDDDDDDEEDDEDDDAIDLLGEDDADREVEEKPTAHKTSVNTSGRKRPAPRGGGRAANSVKKSRRRVSFADDDDEEEDEEGEGDHAMEVDGAGDRREMDDRKDLRRSVRSSSVRVKYNDDESEQDDEQGEETEDEEQQQDGEEEGGGGEEESGEGSEEEEGRGKEHDEDAEEDGDEEEDEHRARNGRKPRSEASMGGGAAVEVDDDDDDVEVVEAPKPKRANKAPAPKVKPQQRKPLSIPTSKRVRRATEENDDEDDDDEDEEEDDDDDSDFSG